MGIIDAFDHLAALVMQNFYQLCVLSPQISEVHMPHKVARILVAKFFSTLAFFAIEIKNSSGQPKKSRRSKK